jgi:hypothetical protein
MRLMHSASSSTVMPDTFSSTSSITALIVGLLIRDLIAGLE